MTSCALALVNLCAEFIKMLSCCLPVPGAASLLEQRFVQTGAAMVALCLLYGRFMLGDRRVVWRFQCSESELRLLFPVAGVVL